MSDAVGLTFLILLMGLLGVIWPDKIAQLHERLHSIGSKTRWSEVEPANWKVVFTRLFGIALVGAAVLLWPGS